MALGQRNVIPIFRSAFQSPADEYDPNLGVRPMVFDILAPDRETSILPESLKMVLHVNPSNVNFNYSKVIERIQTKGGYVEQHWGDAPTTISLTMVTGGFMRLYSGLSNITGGGQNMGGTRRETIAYDKYLDLLALFKNNGAVYDTTGKIVFQGVIKMTFDGGVYLGWFNSFSVTENTERPYMFELNADLTVAKEILRLRSVLSAPPLFVPTDPNAASSLAATPAAPGLPPPTGTPQPTAAEAAAAAGATVTVQDPFDIKPPSRIDTVPWEPPPRTGTTPGWQEPDVVLPRPKEGRLSFRLTGGSGG